MSLIRPAGLKKTVYIEFRRHWFGVFFEGHGKALASLS